MGEHPNLVIARRLWDAIRGTRSLDIEHLFMIRVVDGRITEAVFAPVDQQRYDRFFSPP